MHRSTLPKFLALLISGSILFSSVPVYAEETTSLTASVTKEVSAEPDDIADNSYEDGNCFLADEDIAGESLTDTVDENRETPAGPDSGSTTRDGSNTSDSRSGGNEANVEDGRVDLGSETVVGDADTAGKNDTNSSDSDIAGKNDTNSNDADTLGKNDTSSDDADTAGKNDTNFDDVDTAGKNDTNSGDSETCGEQNSSLNTLAKKESFAHLYYDDVNDPAYDELRKELDEIFQNTQLQDTTDLPESYSLVSLPFGGEGTGGSADRSAPIEADQGRDVLMPVYDQGGSMSTCWSFTGTGAIESYLIRNHYDKLREQGIELSKWQVPVSSSMYVSKDTVIGGYSADPSQYGEGIGSSLYGGGEPTTYGQAVTSWAGLDYEENVPTPRKKEDVTGLAPAQVDQAVARGRDALFLLSPTPNMIGHEGYDKEMDPAEAVVYDAGAVAAIKNCLMKIGPVYTEICYMPDEPAEKGGVKEFENWEYGSMYYPLWTDETIAGHAVTIVGWDDHYSRDLFGENTPPGDGAFLIKNSFGKMEGDSMAGDQSLFREGYFWLSFYDATIQTPATFTGTLVEDGNYDHLYMNDYIGFTNAPYVEIREGAFDRDRNEDGVIRIDEIVKCANVFTAKDNEMLKSVGMLANRASLLAEYWIYLLKEGYSDPEDGELIYSAAGENGIKAKYAGYNVQDLLTPIALVKGQLFSVVARIFGSEGGQLPLEAESNMSDSPYVKTGRGQTYYTDENGNWVDVCDFELAPELFAVKIPEDPVTAVGNATIRAMTSDADLSYRVTSGDGSVWKSDAASGLKVSASGERGNSLTL